MAQRAPAEGGRRTSVSTASAFRLSLVSSVAESGYAEAEGDANAMGLEGGDVQRDRGVYPRDLPAADRLDPLHGDPCRDAERAAGGPLHSAPVPLRGAPRVRARADGAAVRGEDAGHHPVPDRRRRAP